MILRDPVHGLVAFEGRAERVVASLLATREVQRLRRVRQLGLASLVFPGAEHSRFAHAIGAAHLMSRLTARVREIHHGLPAELHLDDESAVDAVAAALLHDLGHGPFSHTFEDAIRHARGHELWTVDAIRSGDTEVHQVLEELSAGMSGRVAALLTGEHPLAYLCRAISGTLDVDRSDYLLRDSHMTGVSYGLYDLDWLLQARCFGQLPDGQWVLAIEGRKGLPPIEGFFLGRHFMYQQVYHHKATRAAESLVRAIFVRLVELVQDGRPPSPLPAALRATARGEQAELSDYLQLDDARLLASLDDWERGDDDLLADLCRRLRNRQLPKTVPLPDAAPEVWEEARQRAAEVVRASGRRADLTVWLDVAADTPYAEPVDDSTDGLWVVIRRQPIRRLGDTSFLLGELRNKRIERPRLIFPAEAREQVEAAIEGVIG